MLFPASFLSLLANRCRIYEATVVVDPNNWNSSSNPLGFRFYKHLALFVSDLPFRRYCKHGPHNMVRRLFGWLLQMSDAFECLVNVVPTTSLHTLLALNGDFGSIKINTLVQALELKEEILQKVLRIVSNTDSVPHCTLNSSIESKAAQKRLADIKSPATPPAEPKRAKSEPTKREPHDTFGCLIYRKKEAMPTVQESDPKKRVCAPHVRDGMYCKKRHRGCLSIHSNEPETWPIPVLRAWVDLVEREPDLHWHSNVEQDRIKARLESAAAGTNATA